MLFFSTYISFYLYSNRTGLFDVIGCGRAESVKYYQEWIEDVKNTVPEDRLLIYNIKDGWKPLCDFLNVPIPDSPFPFLEDTSVPRKGRDKLKLISYITLFTLPVLISIFLAYFFNYKA